MKIPKHFNSLLTLGFTLLILTVLLSGCSEQPLGYVYQPTSSNISRLAWVTVDIVGMVFDHMDESVGFLEDASHTNNWETILSGGWIAIPTVDSVSGNPYTLFYNNYMDQKFKTLRFDKQIVNDAIRTPSDVEYTYVTLRNFRNNRNNEIYTDTDDNLHLIIEYSDARQDPKNVNGWMNITRSVPFVEEIVNEEGTQSWVYYMHPTWVIRIEDFSTDPLDQSARLVIEGTFPHNDETGNYRADHVSGEIIIQSNGTGVGELNLYGEPVIRLHFTGRGYGFEGYYTYHKYDHSYKVRF
ncbi:MAG: hypothetical protein P9X24_10615 [Candidatus Hatepunaea meridiana]|nr:hypothetical protein [Candidatus Hatepunaea meridiana]